LKDVHIAQIYKKWLQLKKEVAMKNQLDMYIAAQNELVKEYNGKIIAVKDGKALGVYPSKTEALEDMAKRYEPGTFIIIKCTSGDEEYNRRFRSRVHIRESAYA
jgi:hypothetical protein